MSQNEVSYRFQIPVDDVLRLATVEVGHPASNPSHLSHISKVI